jgi:hypothetical protein
VRPLQDLLEREFDLKFHGGFSIDEIRSMDVRKLSWFHDRLRKQLTNSKEPENG